MSWHILQGGGGGLDPNISVSAAETFFYCLKLVFNTGVIPHSLGFTLYLKQRFLLHKDKELACMQAFGSVK